MGNVPKIFPIESIWRINLKVRNLQYGIFRILSFSLSRWLKILLPGGFFHVQRFFPSDLSVDFM